MKQLEEIQKAENQLIKIKQELLTVQKKLDKNITRRIEQKEGERNVVFIEIAEIKEAFVSPITDAPRQYVGGYSHLMKKELWNQTYECEQMWHIFADEVKKIPEIMELNKTRDRLENEICDLRATGDYDDLLGKIDELKRNQRIKERLVENLKSIGWFRQYAKDAIATEERRKNAEIVAERKKDFQKKIEKEYLPLMKKSLDKYLEEMPK